MTFDDIRLVLYRYFLVANQRGKELSAACRAMGHGRIEIVIQDGKPIQVNIFGSQREDKEMDRKIAELLDGRVTATLN